ncbi:hypothetical protein E2C01_052003 [Portunus trituberculatus]|uniref:Uncharacterized protein n=1 Tax=Portunus trituberculatus TaxID=210409 RepID=A0A5B7GDA6_PORTR|nr:hypothetical protein [Portunus trituberculatus]
MLSSVLLMLPYHLLLLLQAAALNIPFWAKVRTGTCTGGGRGRTGFEVLVSKRR